MSVQKPIGHLSSISGEIGILPFTQGFEYHIKKEFGGGCLFHLFDKVNSEYVKNACVHVDIEHEHVPVEVTDNN